MNWIEVSLLVDGEMAEAVAEVLARYVSGGVVISSTAIEAGLEDVGRVVGPLKVAAYLPEDENLEDVRRKIEEGLYYLGRIRPLPPATFTAIQETNWVETWKEHYHPIPVGQRLIILPSWYENPEPSRIPIIIEPGMAFGTGTHPTTQICLELLEAHWPGSSPPPSIIDIGCGSGILTIAASKLGAARLLGVDIDAEALDNARQNADLNGVFIFPLTLFNFPLNCFPFWGCLCNFLGGWGGRVTSGRDSFRLYRQICCWPTSWPRSLSAYWIRGWQKSSTRTGL